MDGIKVTPVSVGAEVYLPRSWSLFRKFRSAFPKAAPGSAAWCWIVPGKDAAKRVELFFAEELTILKVAERQAAWAKEEALWNEASV